jgi:anhydro-N-acetylmuramic acid kinase
MAKYIGLMSGTSMDGVDAVLCYIESGECHTLDSTSLPYPPTLLAMLHSLCSPSVNELNTMAVADRLVAETFAKAVIALLEKTDTSAADITAIGSHGQTIRHFPQTHLDGDAQISQFPPHDHRSFTLQIGDPNTIAVLTNIDVIADFRRKDIALGGQGAPLVPAYHQAVFAHNTASRVLVNIGGIANLSLLTPKIDGSTPLGYDTGPGNTLMDAWIARHYGKPYDANGQWASSGKVDNVLLAHLLTDPFFSKNGPKSTGREYFNLTWLDDVLKTIGRNIATEDVQATLLELTVNSIASAVMRHKLSLDTQVIVCGGGAFNSALMKALSARLSPHPVDNSRCLNIHPQHVEGAAFAWFAYAHINRISGNVPGVTGASRNAVLGAYYSAD